MFFYGFLQLICCASTWKKQSKTHRSFFFIFWWSNHMKSFPKKFDFFIISDQKTVMILNICLLLVCQRFKWCHQGKGFMTACNPTFIGLNCFLVFSFVALRCNVEFSIDSLCFSTNYSSANSRWFFLKNWWNQGICF